MSRRGPAAMAREWYTTGEVAEIVGLNPKTIQSYCDRGQIEDVTHTLGGMRRISALGVARLRKQMGLPAVDYLPTIPPEPLEG